MSFTGFSKEFPQFLFPLEFSNTMERLAENKGKYRTLITQPLTLLFNDLIPVVSSISSTIETKPTKCISSMYNDMRFSRGTPLKTYMYVRFKEPFRAKDALGFYFDMGYEYYSYGIRIYKQTSAGMDLMRNAVLHNKERFGQALKALGPAGMSVIGDRYAKDRFPDMKDPEIKQLLNHRNFYIGHDHPVSETVFTVKLADEISAAFVDLKDIYSLFKESLYN